MLIFDRFPTEQAARAFASAVEKEFKLKTWFFKDQESSNEVDLFAFELVPPIVLVERPATGKDNLDDEIEEKVEHAVQKFGGEFAGT